MIKALFFDIDGTLVSFKTHKIPRSTVEAITMAKNRDIKVYISTGRPRQLIDNINEINHLVDGYITVNGAYCFEEEEIISCHPIPEETMAFGDGGNDISIIKKAGVGIAMGNANEPLKNAADYITDSVDDDGIYKALEHWIFR